MPKISLVSILAFVAASGLVGCVAPTGDGEAIATQNELRNGIDVLFVSYDRRAQRFTLEIELDRSVLSDPDARYLVAELAYASDGRTVSPYSATAVGDVDFVAVGRDRLSAELEVAGPAPDDVDDVHARVGANPTPHP